MITMPHIRDQTFTEILWSSRIPFHYVILNQLMIDLRSREPEYDGCAIIMIIPEVGIESITRNTENRPFSFSEALSSRLWLTEVDLLHQ